MMVGAAKRSADDARGESESEGARSCWTEPAAMRGDKVTGRGKMVARSLKTEPCVMSGEMASDVARSRQTELVAKRPRCGAASMRGEGDGEGGCGVGDVGDG